MGHADVVRLAAGEPSGEVEAYVVVGPYDDSQTVLPALTDSLMRDDAAAQ